MKHIATDIWVIETDFQLLGAELGNRMTVIKLSNGELLVHSPVKVNKQIFEQVNSLGRVGYIITPNNYHGLFAQEWCQEYPQAVHYSAKTTALDVNSRVLTEYIDDIVAQNISIIKIEGAPKVNEFAFYHKSSRSLILTDIAFNIGENISLWSKVFFSLNTAYKRFGPSRLMKSLITNHAQLKVSIIRLLELDFERIIVSHGDILQTNARQSLLNAFGDCYDSATIGRKIKTSCG